jgi:sugar phosphate permease
MRSHTPSAYLPWLMFLVASSFYLYEFLLRVSPNVLAEELMAEFAMDAKQFGLFSSFYYWAYAPLQLPVGAMTDNYGPRRLLTFAIVLCSISTLILACTHEFYLGCIARLCIGAGSAFAFICCVKIIQIWFPRKMFPFLTGLTLAIGTLGAAVGGTPLSFALNLTDWRSLMSYIGFVGLVLAFICWFVVKDSNQSTASEKQNNSGPGFWACLRVVVRQPQVWLVGVYAFFVTAPSDAFGGAWGVKFLMEVHDISRDAASFAAVSMTFVGMAFGSSMVGWLSGYFDNRKSPMCFSALIASVALTFIVFTPTLTGFSAAILFFIFGASGTYVLAFVVIRMITKSNYVATAVGFVNMLSIFGSALVTFFIGWLLDSMRSGHVGINGEPIYLAQDFQVSLVILPIFYLISALLIVPFIREQKDLQHVVC